MTALNPFSPKRRTPAPSTVHERFDELLKLTSGNGQPNINALWRIAKDLDAIRLNIKFFGYELAKALAEALPPAPVDGPFDIDLQSKPSTQEDLESAWTRHWSSELKVAHVFHRKLWELAYALQAIHQLGHMREGSRGLGFGCGEEPLPSYLASRGCCITVTDMPSDLPQAALWAQSHQYASADKAFRAEFLDRATFDDRVLFRYVDMNAIPDDLRDYDFCWSVCAFEHLGSIEKGMAFIERTIDTLRPGGLSVHTTEFNFLNDEETIDNWATVLFQRRHFLEMAHRLEAKGCEVAPLSFDVGSKPLDKFIDLPPFGHDWRFHQAESWKGDNNHIKVAVDGFAATCFGLIAMKRC